ncbi:MAG: cyclic nucleotide-binding domain-containing protein [Candidatus Omnitrophica bacterium]|nr:cyclic nucleotide-binding domain-containing protein [Candidatus Omnitrophota bacterium]MDD5352857.1 cyclic nucleotide-binding domain-containing protein [Candidatus Omnitrophota bacterium]MDD5550456.1 cyclic nucleotide-binding domain-containing protein [Candidatus Omnitrophota bacterium]
MATLEPILTEHPFFKDLSSKYIDFLIGCTSHVVFKAGEVIIKEGESADKFYIIRSGQVLIYIDQPRQISIQTIREGNILGWSWLIPPYRYRFTAKAVENTRALALDGKCLREKCEKNSDLGYELLKRLMSVFTERLEATRLQLIDIYK